VLEAGIATAATALPLRKRFLVVFQTILMKVQKLMSKDVILVQPTIVVKQSMFSHLHRLKYQKFNQVLKMELKTCSLNWLKKNNKFFVNLSSIALIRLVVECFKQNYNHLKMKRKTIFSSLVWFISCFLFFKMWWQINLETTFAKRSSKLLIHRFFKFWWTRCSQHLLTFL